VTRYKVMKIARRVFLGCVAAAPAFANVSTLATVKTRKAAKYELVYKTPHGKPNGLCLTNEGMWVQDQGPESWMSLINPADGKVIREFKVDVNMASGVCIDDENVMWVTSTHNSMIVSCSPIDGKTIAKYWTPGAGRIYRRKGDPPSRASKLQPAYPSEACRGGRGPERGPLPFGQLPLSAQEGAGGTGAHGIVYRDGLLYYANPPARAVFVIDNKTWEVQNSWPVPGNRPHDMIWDGDGKTLWNPDSNLNAFFRFDANTGKMLERVQLEDDSPVIHGAKIYQGYMWCCDDVGWMWRFKWS
jgi:sugar lactone lactonase YvrE